MEASLRTLASSDVPGYPRLVLLSLHILPLIDNILDEPSNGLGPRIAISIPLLSHHTLGFFNLTYILISPVPGIVRLPLGFPQALPNIFPLNQQLIEPPFHIHGRLLLLSPDLLNVPICA